MKQPIDLNNKTILVTGAAGFIGSNLVMELLRTLDSVNIINIDNMNDYYDVSLKKWRLKQIDELVAKCQKSKYTFIKGDISDKSLIDKIFADYKPDVVVNLAAQAGVRYSITNPDAYIKSNIIGFYNILEACRHSYDNITEPPFSKGDQGGFSSSNAKQQKVEAEAQEQTYQGVQHLVYACSKYYLSRNRSN